jgi:hypothetical protein
MRVDGGWWDAQVVGKVGHWVASDALLLGRRAVAVACPGRSCQKTQGMCRDGMSAWVLGWLAGWQMDERGAQKDGWMDGGMGWKWKSGSVCLRTCMYGVCVCEAYYVEMELRMGMDGCQVQILKASTPR